MRDEQRDTYRGHRHVSEHTPGGTLDGFLDGLLAGRSAAGTMETVPRRRRRAPSGLAAVMPARPVALFDFDRTIVRADVFKAFSGVLLRRHWWRAAVTLTAAPILGPLWGPASTRLFAASGFLWIGTAGLAPVDFQRLLRAYVERRFAPDAPGAPLAHQQALDAIAAHRDAGDRVVIVTAAAADLVAAACECLGLTDVEIVGSSLRPWAGGIVTREHCHGSDKVRMLLARGLLPPYEYVYTDSAADLPLLERGRQRYLVNPGVITRLKVASRLGTGGYRILWWR
jgi:phosphatidylglycerophosphatase C